jgi:putative transposase
MRPLSYAGYRFPPEIIQHAIWLYLRFTLSFRDVEELLAERGIDVSYETIRRWVAVFGPVIARRLRAMRPKPHTTWHLDEMFVSIGGKKMYLWRAVDAEGEVLDCLVQSRRNTGAALRLMRKLIRKYRMVPSKFVTDRLPSYAAARAELPVTIAHERGLRQNNRAESSHVPVRRRERKMQRFRSAGSAQRFLSAHASVYNIFNICRHLIRSATKRRFRSEAFDAWRAAAGIAA